MAGWSVLLNVQEEDPAAAGQTGPPYLLFRGLVGLLYLLVLELELGDPLDRKVRGLLLPQESWEMLDRPENRQCPRRWLLLPSG